MTTIGAQPSVPRQKTTFWPRAESLVLPLAGLLIAVVVWWALTSPRFYEGVMRTAFSPEQTYHATRDLLGSGILWPHMTASLRRVMLGLLCALAIGVPVGLLVGLSRRVESATTLTFQMLRMISPLAWMPLAVMVLGVGDLPVYFLLTMAAVWPVMLSTAAGVHAIDPRWLRLTQSLCASRAQTLRLIILPAILRQVLTGLRMALGVLWLVLVPAEMLGVNAGLGYFVLDTRDRLAYSELMAAILLIGMIGFVLDLALRLLASLLSHPNHV